MMLREYAEDDDKLEQKDDIGDPLSEDSDTAPPLITSRDDFGSMVDDFLDNYEILGSRMKPKLEGETGAEKLGILRAAMGLDHRVTVQEEAKDDEDELLEMEDEDEKDRWDCETILSTPELFLIPFQFFTIPQLHTPILRTILASYEQETSTSSRK
jgi:protein LTV1